MRKLKNSEVAKYVFEELEKKGLVEKYEVNFEKILKMVDDSITYNKDYEIDENGEIENELEEDKIVDLKTKELNGIEDYLETIQDYRDEEEALQEYEEEQESL